MACKKNELYQAYCKLFQKETSSLENKASSCQGNDMTMKQIYYLRVIDEKNGVTFSELAQETCNSKPTISELISRFISMDCVYRERSVEDRRVYYIYLTSKGKSIARAQEQTQLRFIEHIEESLTEAELNQLIQLLNKII